MSLRRSLPGWIGPLIGALAGVRGAMSMAQDGERVDATTILLMAGLGASAGCIVWIWDSEPRSTESGPASTAARVAAALGLMSLFFVFVWGIVLLIESDAYTRAHPEPIPMPLYVATLVVGIAMPLGVARLAHLDLRRHPNKTGRGMVRFVYAVTTLNALLLAIATLQMHL